jgi:hypothetical protein
MASSQGFWQRCEELKAQLELFSRRAQRRARQQLGEKVISEVLANKNDKAAQ